DLRASPRARPGRPSIALVSSMHPAVLSFWLATPKVDAGEQAAGGGERGGAPWDGATGMKLIAEWDGQGMIATQSHAMRFDGFPATRAAWPGHLQALAAAGGSFVAGLFFARTV